MQFKQMTLSIKVKNNMIYQEKQLGYLSTDESTRRECKYGLWTYQLSQETSELFPRSLLSGYSIPYERLYLVSGYLLMSEKLAQLLEQFIQVVSIYIENQSFEISIRDKSIPLACHSSNYKTKISMKKVFRVCS
jgi:hypothetical protein